MLKMLCSYCGKLVWHNPQQGKNKGGYRCTKCGFPASPNPSKHEHQITLMRRLANRVA